MQNVWFVASVWMGIAFLASLISIRLGVSVALIEILLGVVAGNAFHIQSNDWVGFLATFGALLLTFLAGAEIDPESLRSHLKQSMAIGVIAFLIPFLGVLAFAYWFAGWTYQQALIAGIALSTTSVAVVYAVLVENGLSRTELGKMILAACFINDFGTVLALGAFFANFNRWMVLFVVVMAVMLYFLPSWTRGIIKSLGATRVSEPEVKFLFLVLFFLGGLATMAKSEAVLPAYLAGLVVAGVFLNDRVLVNRMRSIAFTMLTPFYFIKAGLFVSISALIPTAGLVVILLGIKMLTKFTGVWPLSYGFGIPPRERMYTTMLMSTGLTFGTISALFGLENHIISQAQYTVLVTVVILSAVVPTLIAERFFMPDTGVEAVREKHGPQPVRTANE
ncbi:cation:proton antiporter [Candidatus Binatus sp.]|jgi:Kef-type K+ transport system membrane component KefB|uniref:cation:proton antiporter n=1 Tax=Candidatus Binatus sp. TaxID=2811406 RepID=UPI003BC21E39